jgi:hypothetical protein
VGFERSVAVHFFKLPQPFRAYVEKIVFGVQKLAFAVYLYLKTFVSHHQLMFDKARTPPWRGTLLLGVFLQSLQGVGNENESPLYLGFSSQNLKVPLTRGI